MNLYFNFLSRFSNDKPILFVADNLQLICEDRKGKMLPKTVKVNIKVRGRKKVASGTIAIS